MPPFFRGPFYCEMPGWLGGMFEQPLNTYSNLAIILFGVWALTRVVRRAPRAYDLYILCGLLILNGIGSFLWHGLRDRAFLPWDIWPAIVFLLFVVFTWAWRVSSLWTALGVVACFWLAQIGLREIDFGLPGFGRWVAMAPAVIGVGLWLIYRTQAISPGAAWLGGLCLVSALVGLTFRTIDQPICAAFPYGTHFLWHIFLSGGAFLGLTALIRLVNAKKTHNAGLAPAAAAAE